MWSQTITPKGRSLVVEVPEELANQPIQVVLIPTRISTDLETRRGQLHAFFAQYQTDAGLLKYKDMQDGQVLVSEFRVLNPFKPMADPLP